MNNIKKIVDLFLTFFKIGLFTFGGGYAMISVIREECVEKKHLLSDEEFVNVVAVAKSTPGPIAINMATYIGFKETGLIGAIICTLGVIIPSIVIIYIISLFFKNILNIPIVEKAFVGIRIAVGVIIIRSAMSLIKNEINGSENKNLTIFFIGFFSIGIIIFSLLGINISIIHIIVTAILISFAIIIYKSAKGEKL